MKPAANQHIDPRLAAAYARGRLLRAKLQQAEGGSISASKAAGLLGVSRATVLRWHRTGKLIGWKEGKSALRIPVWQFKGRDLLPGLSEVLRAASAGWDTISDHEIMLFLLANRNSLKGRRLIDLLREGDVAKAKMVMVSDLQTEQFGDSR
jgi:hypothetical protein